MPPGSLPSLPLSPITQDKPGLPSCAPSVLPSISGGQLWVPSPPQRMWALLASVSHPQASPGLCPRARAPQILRKECRVAERRHVFLPCRLQIPAFPEQVWYTFPWCEAIGEGFGGDRANNLLTSGKNVWFHGRFYSGSRPIGLEGSSSLCADTRELDARTFLGDYFAHLCNSAALGSREVERLAQGP